MDSLTQTSPFFVKKIKKRLWTFCGIFPSISSYGSSSHYVVENDIVLIVLSKRVVSFYVIWQTIMGSHIWWHVFGKWMVSKLRSFLFFKQIVGGVDSLSFSLAFLPFPSLCLIFLPWPSPTQKPSTGLDSFMLFLTSTLTLDFWFFF